MVLCLVLAGCTVGPNFVPPDVHAPAQWGQEPGSSTEVNGVGTQQVATHASTPALPASAASAATTATANAGSTHFTYGAAVDGRWWNHFNDPELTSLVNRLSAQNLDVAAAAERIDQALSARQVTRSQGLPKIDGQASYQRQRVSPAGTTSLETPAPGAPYEYNLYEDGLSASWELDLFGRVRRGVEAASANLQVAVEARHGIALSAMAELARDYMQLRGAQTDEAIVQRNIALAQQNIALVASQQQNGVATTLDMAQARAEAASLSATLPSLRALQSQLINAIGLLLAEPPRALANELAADPAPPSALTALQPSVPFSVPVGLPGTLARQRPDIREAEAKLHAATAETGVAVASFYPDVTLMGNFDLQGLQFSNAFAMADRTFGVGPSIDLPIFQGGRLRGTLHLRQAQQREAAIQFRKTVLQGWQEVDDAMTAFAQVQQARGQLEDAWHENQIALNAARQRYAQGVVDYLNVLSVQRAVLQSERSLADNTTEQENDLVTLYLALGGGWDVADRAPTDHVRQ